MLLLETQAYFDRKHYRSVDTEFRLSERDQQIARVQRQLAQTLGKMIRPMPEAQRTQVIGEEIIPDAAINRTQLINWFGVENIANPDRAFPGRHQFSTRPGEPEELLHAARYARCVEKIGLANQVLKTYVEDVQQVGEANEEIILGSAAYIHFGVMGLGHLYGVDIPLAHVARIAQLDSSRSTMGL